MTNLTILSKDIRIINGLFSLNDLHKASGREARHAPFRFVRLEQTQELIAEIEQAPDLVLANSSTEKISKGGIPPLQVKHGGTNSGTWVCKELVYSYAMWISAKFHLQVIRAFDAMTSRQPIASSVPVADDTPFLEMDYDQSRFLRCILRLSEKLEEREKETFQEVIRVRKQIQMMQKLCTQLDSEIAAFEHRVVSDLNVVKHMHLYRSLALEDKGNPALRSFMTEPY